MASSPDIPGLTYACHQYGHHSLQRIGVWQFDGEAAEAASYWIIFVHGGAWRDPRNSLCDFVPSIKHMLSLAGLPKSALRGFASLDYRLSPHPLFPQDPASTPAEELHDAEHPVHVRDVLSGLRLLDAEYGIGGNYVLVGHSAGGTLIHQVIMNGDASCGWGPSAPLPSALISISGIYDLRGLADRHGAAYEAFTTGAFGPDKQVWDAASPARFAGSFAALWPNPRRLVILANSAEDTLIDMPELDGMEAKLIRDGIAPVAIRDLTLEHDQIWEDGTQVAALVATAVAKLRQ
ncbi:kynurenine formamidase, partial [Trichoderma cornu-damae]